MNLVNASTGRLVRGRSGRGQRLAAWAAGALALVLPLLSGGGPARADALATPAMAGPLAADPTPDSLDAGPLGKVYVSGALTGLAWVQDHAAPGDRASGVDLGDAQLFIQKTDGPIQFFVQVGGYALPALGVPYNGASNAAHVVGATYGYLPQAYLKLAPTPEFNLIVGKLPTLVGAEYTFTYENLDITRGLLWSQEPAVSRGAQANWAKGPWSLSLSLTDGYYSDRYSWLTGSLGYAFSPADSLTVIGGGNLSASARSSAATPRLLDNGQVYNLIYTHAQGPWTVTPYLHYGVAQTSPAVGAPGSGSTLGGAILARYSFGKGFSLAGRSEYIASSGPQSLLWGPHSRAWSLTLTPTWQIRQWFVRAEAAYTRAEDARPGLAFGRTGNAPSQTRGLVQTGILF